MAKTSATVHTLIKSSASKASASSTLLYYLLWYIALK